MTQTYGILLLVVVVGSFLLAAIWDVCERLWRARRDRPGPPPYDWRKDNGLLDVWAREDEGEVLTVLPQWLWKIPGAGTREW